MICTISVKLFFRQWQFSRRELLSVTPFIPPLLPQENFCGTSIIVPDLEAVLHLKEDGKKSWKQRLFQLRASGIYYVPKGKSKVRSQSRAWFKNRKQPIDTQSTGYMRLWLKLAEVQKWKIKIYLGGTFFRRKFFCISTTNSALLHECLYPDIQDKIFLLFALIHQVNNQNLNFSPVIPRPCLLCPVRQPKHLLWQRL